MKQLIYAAALAALALTSCSQSGNGWSISGTIDGATTSDTLAIEGYNNGLWYNVDSLPLADGGRFSYHATEAAPYPEIMRVSLAGRSIYFPVDSIDAIELTASAADFGSRYSLSGTEAAANIQRIDSILNASVASAGPAATVADSALKADLFRRAYSDPGVISYYYLINKSVDGRPLLDLSNPADRRLFLIATQRFINTRPDDPRTAWLKARAEEALRRGADAQPVALEATQAGLIEINRADARGTARSLRELASKGHVTLLSFTNYSAESSMAYNAILNTIWEAHPGDIEIYQIAFDADETRWRQTAANLPWTTVWNSTTEGIKPLTDYNVGALPMTFIIDRGGNLVERVTDPAELSKKVARYF